MTSSAGFSFYMDGMGWDEMNRFLAGTTLSDPFPFQKVKDKPQSYAWISSDKESIYVQEEEDYFHNDRSHCINLSKGQSNTIRVSNYDFLKEGISKAERLIRALQEDLLAKQAIISEKTPPKHTAISRGEEVPMKELSVA